MQSFKPNIFLKLKSETKVRESAIEKALHARIKALGGEHRRVVWQGRSHAPDDLVLLPGRHLLVECKRPGEVPRSGQIREHARLRAAGFEVHTISSIEQIESILPCPN